MGSASGHTETGLLAKGRGADPSHRNNQRGSKNSPLSHLQSSSICDTVRLMFGHSPTQAFCSVTAIYISERKAVKAGGKCCITLAYMLPFFGGQGPRRLELLSLNGNKWEGNRVRPNAHQLTSFCFVFFVFVFFSINHKTEKWKSQPHWSWLIVQVCKSPEGWVWFWQEKYGNLKG